MGELDEDEMRELLVIEIDHLRAELAKMAQAFDTYYCRNNHVDPETEALIAKWLPKQEPKQEVSDGE